MASLNASGIPVVPKQNAGWRSLGRNIIVTSGTNVHQQASVRAQGVQGTPAYARDAADFGTQSTPTTESFLHLPRQVKHAESVNDTTVKRVLEQVPVTSGNQPELALINVTTKHKDHRGNRIVEQDTIQNIVLQRTRNDSVRPGGEI